jgi:carbohydrate kinase (thermoresistant glucokinase family)
MIVVMMGVCGCGKTSVGQRIAARMGCRFIEGDDLHSVENQEKMASGTPLTDDDRWPWLDSIAAEMRALDQAGESAVIACSALRQAYRDRLRRSGADVRFVHLTGDVDVIRERMGMRRGHYMPLSLLDSQLATLEPARADEILHEIDVNGSVDRIAEVAIAALFGTPGTEAPSG